MYVHKYKVDVTVDESGDATAYTPYLSGRISAIIYAKDDFADGVDFTVTVEGTGEAVWSGTDVNASTKVCPRQPTHDTSGTASLYAGAGEPVEDYICVANDRIKIVVASGGNATSGTFYVVMT